MSSAPRLGSDHVRTAPPHRPRATRLAAPRRGHPARARRALPRAHRAARRRARRVRDRHRRAARSSGRMPWPAPRRPRPCGGSRSPTRTSWRARGRADPIRLARSSPTSCPTSPTSSSTALDDAGTVSLGKTNTPEFGLPELHRTARERAGPHPVRPDARRRGIQRRGRRRGGGGSAAVRARVGRRRLDPHPGGLDRTGRAEAVARPHPGRAPDSATPGGSGRPGAARPHRRRCRAAARRAGRRGPVPRTPPRRRPGTAARILNAAVRGEGRFQLGRHDLVAVGDRLRPRARARGAGGARGRGRASSPRSATDSRSSRLDAGGAGTPPAFRTVWQAGAAGIPVEGDDVDAARAADALAGRARARASARASSARRCSWLTVFERRADHGASRPYDAVLTPSLALTPRPLGWYDAEDGERNFAQQVQFTPFTSMVNVARPAGDHAAGVGDRRRPADGRAADRAPRRRARAARDRRAAGATAGLAAAAPAAVVNQASGEGPQAGVPARSALAHVPAELEPGADLEPVRRRLDPAAMYSGMNHSPYRFHCALCSASCAMHVVAVVVVGQVDRADRGAAAAERPRRQPAEVVHAVLAVNFPPSTQALDEDAAPSRTSSPAGSRSARAGSAQRRHPAHTAVDRREEPLGARARRRLDVGQRLHADSSRP